MLTRIPTAPSAGLCLALAFASAGCGCGRGLPHAIDAGPATDDLGIATDLAMPSGDLSSSGAPPDAAPPDAAPAGPTQAYNFRIDAAHTGSQPHETLAPPLRRVWSVDVGAHATYALVAHGRVFAASGGGGTFPSDGSVVGVDIKNGQPLWGPLPLGHDLMIAYADGSVFVTIDNTKLVALDETTGLTRWTAPMAWSDNSPPVTANGLVYINSYDGNATLAFDQKTGALKWKTSLVDGSPGAPAVDNGKVYVTGGCATNALDALAGTPSWKLSAACTGGGGGMASVWGGQVYARNSPFEDSVIVSADKGQLRGTFNSDAPLAFANGLAYSRLGSTLRALDVATMSTRWSFRGDGHLITSPLVVGGYAYVASSTGMIYALDGSGHPAWSDDSHAAIGSDADNLSLSAGEGTLLVPVGNHIVAYRADPAAPPPDMTPPPPDMTDPPDLGAPPTRTEAPSFRIDTAHTGGQPDETLTPPLELAWSYDAGDTIAYPLVAKGRVFISTATGLTTAIDTRSGAVVWGPSTLAARMLYAYDNGRLFGVDRNDVLEALDATNGAPLWTIWLPQLDCDAPPVAANGRVYVNGLESGGDTYAVDEETGKVVWDNHTFDGSSGAVAVAGGSVFEIEGCMQVHVWNAASGAVQWNHSTGCTGGGGAAPAVYGGRLYARDLFKPDTIFTVGGDSVLGTFATTVPPAFANDVGYYLQGTALVAIPVAGSTPSWSFSGDGALTSAPVAAGAFVYVGSSLGNLYALDGSGQQVWTTMLAAGVNSNAETNSMAVAEGTLLVPAGNVLYAFRSATP